MPEVHEGISSMQGGEPGPCCGVMRALELREKKEA